MAFAHFRDDFRRARDRRRIYARINALPANSTVREELVAIAQRHHEDV